MEKARSVDKENHVSDKYRENKAAGTITPLPENCLQIAEGAHALLQSISAPHALGGMITDGRKITISGTPLNEYFYKKEYKKLWNLINHNYVYTVTCDSGQLIEKAITHMDDKMFVIRL